MAKYLANQVGPNMLLLSCKLVFQIKLYIVYFDQQTQAQCLESSKKYFFDHAHKTLT